MAMGFLQVFDVRDMPNPINAAYTSVQLQCHMDLVYYEAPPGIQLFHSIQ
jgi:gamma-butyrobetaine dioxygenase